MIALENVRLRFDSRGIAGLSGVSFSLREGTVTALMGPNGSGKTTLLRILAGELLPDSGSVKLDGNAVFARIPQVDPDLNVQKFLTGRAPSGVPEEKKIQLSRDLADIFEFTFQLRQTMGQLSAGQKQKVFLAGELIGNPRLILLDEPFTHLDPQTRKEILTSLFEYVRRQNQTLLWVTHETDEAARYSDELILLQHGKIEQKGTAEELITSPRNIFVAQFMGYHNFFPVKKSGASWMTPWGLQAFPQGPQAEEAIMVVPDSAWEIRNDSPLRAVVQKEYFRGTLRTVEALIGERKVLIQGNLPPAKPGQSLGIVPRFTVCFLITL